MFIRCLPNERGSTIFKGILLWKFGILRNFDEIWFFSLKLLQKRLVWFIGIGKRKSASIPYSHNNIWPFCGCVNFSFDGWRWYAYTYLLCFHQWQHNRSLSSSYIKVNRFSDSKQFGFFYWILATYFRQIKSKWM